MVSRHARFFLAINALTGLIGMLDLSIVTAFLLAIPVNYAQLAIIYGLMLGVSVLLEYPSGNLADRLGRKMTHALGVMLIAMQFLGFAAFQAIHLLYLAAILGGAGSAMTSASLEAWLITEEKSRHPQATMHRVFGLRRSVTSMVSAAGSLMIGLLLQVELATLYWAMGIVMLGTAIFTMFYLPDNHGEGNRISDYTFTAVRIFFRSPVMVFLGLVLSAAFACFSALIMYWQPRAVDYGVLRHQLPAIWAIYLLGAGIMGWLYAKLGNEVGAGVFLLSAFTLIGVSFGLMTFGSGVVVLAAALFCFGLGFGPIGAVFFAWAADIVPADLCASILSLMSAVASLTAALATLGIGLAMQVWGPSTAPVTGLVISLVIVGGLGLKRKKIAHWERVHDTPTA